MPSNVQPSSPHIPWFLKVSGIPDCTTTLGSEVAYIDVASWTSQDETQFIHAKPRASLSIFLTQLFMRYKRAKNLGKQTGLTRTLHNIQPALATSNARAVSRAIFDEP